MSGLVAAHIVAEATGNAYHIEPDTCPAEHGAATLCYSYDERDGTRMCPWFHWVGKTDTRRRAAGDLAASVVLLHMATRHCVVMCELARRNRGPGLWPMLGSPKMQDE
jgi:hypothetical protein